MASIRRFYENCKAKIPGKKGYPKFQKDNRSVEYKVTGWKLSLDRKYITFIDKFKAGRFKLVGSRDLNFYHERAIKRVRIVRRADGYYCQFCIAVERNISTNPTGRAVGIDVGLAKFYTTSDGESVDNPRYLRKSERALKRAQRRVSKKHRKSKKGEKTKQSNNYKKACKRLGRKHLKVQRQRKDFAVQTARRLVKSSDFIAYEDLRVKNLVKNPLLAKSISDVAWRLFLNWVDRYGMLFKRPVVAVPPQYTSQDCSGCGVTTFLDKTGQPFTTQLIVESDSLTTEGCPVLSGFPLGERVKKTLSIRTHICPKCKVVIDRDENAAINILVKALNMAGIALNLSTVGHTGIQAWGDLTAIFDSAMSQGQVGSQNRLPE